MSRKRIQFSSTLDGTLMSELRKLSDDSGIAISKLFDKSVSLLLDYYNEEKEPYRNPRNTRVPTDASVNETNSSYDPPMEQDNPKETLDNITDILGMDLEEVQKSLDLIKDFQDKIAHSDIFKK